VVRLGAALTMVREVAEDTSGRNLGSNLDDNDIIWIKHYQLMQKREDREYFTRAVYSRNRWLK
jgi:hypothetical protein